MSGTRSTVLVVDDEEQVRVLVGEILRMHGYEVLEAGNAEEALSAWNRRRKPIDLLLTDVVMPGINGWELARRLKAEGPDLKVLFMSGYTGDTTQASTCSEPLIHKPFRPTLLAGKVQELLGNS